MSEIRAILVMGLLLHCAAVISPAAPPRELRVDKPIVVLSQQIEELEETTPAAIIPAAAQTTKNAATGSTATPPKQIFPAAREFFRKLSGSSAIPANTGTQQQTLETPPEPERQIIAVSELQLEPLPEQFGHSMPPPGLITPSIISTPGPGIPNCDEQGCVAETLEVAPRSHKIGSRMRFPHLAKLWGK